MNVVALIVAVAAGSWLLLARAGWLARRAHRDANAAPRTMPAWAMGAFALAAGEVPTTLWRAELATVQAWATLTSAGALSVGTEDGSNHVKVHQHDLVAGAVSFSEGGTAAGMVEMTVVPANGAALVLTLDRQAVKTLRMWASRVKETP